VTLGNAPSVHVHDAKIGLRQRVSLVGRLAIPLHGFGVILRYALSIGVHRTEVVLRIRVALLGGQPKPIHRRGVIVGYAPPFGIHLTKIVLRYSIPLLGGFLDPRCVILGYSAFIATHRIDSLRLRDDRRVLLRIILILDPRFRWIRYPRRLCRKRRRRIGIGLIQKETSCANEQHENQSRSRQRRLVQEYRSHRSFFRLLVGSSFPKIGRPG
jgi:hypothetical protein